MNILFFFLFLIYFENLNDIPQPTSVNGLPLGVKRGKQRRGAVEIETENGGNFEPPTAHRGQRRRIVIVDDDNDDENANNAKSSTKTSAAYAVGWSASEQASKQAGRQASCVINCDDAMSMQGEEKKRRNKLKQYFKSTHLCSFAPLALQFFIFRCTFRATY